MFNSIEEIKSAHTGYWFSPDSVRFFDSKFNYEVFPTTDGAYFISSERDGDGPRLYSIRKAVATLHGCEISTVGEFQEFSTLRDVKQAINALTRQGV